MKIDRSKLYNEIEAQFPDTNYSESVNLLARDCMAAAQEWIDEHAASSDSKTKRELRKDLKDYIASKVNPRDSTKAFFIPTFIWIFVANQIITFIVRWIIDRYTRGRGK